MDAKVLRAAVSAAIRVTVSTTLIGCGGNVSTDAGRATSSPTVKDAPPGTSEPATNDAVAPSNSTQPKPSPSTGGSASATHVAGAAAGGTTGSGGSEAGGMSALSGAAGDEASAGAANDVCAPMATACLGVLEQTVPEQPLSDVSQSCCNVILAAISLPPQLGAECFDAVSTRFMQGGGRQLCCHDPNTWQNPACTPWGPPVPPELSREWLLEWSLAA